MRKLITFSCVIMLAFSQQALACSPCVTTLNLQQSLDLSKAVIVGTRITPQTPEEMKYESGPEWVEIRVSDVLKGDAQPGQTIKAKAWSQMCQFGIVTPPGESYVMILRKSGEYYDSLDFGCSVKTLKVKDGTVDTKDGTITLGEFKKLIK